MPRHGNRLQLPTTALLLLPLLAGCGAEDAGGLSGLDLPEFALSGPVLVLEEDGTPEKVFSRVAARRTPSGEVVVSDRTSLETHVFDTNGALLRTLTRRGAGPGELTGAPGIDLHGDTLFAFGAPMVSSSDVDVFSVTSGFVRRVRMSAVNHQGQLYGKAALAGGYYLVEQGSGFTVVPELPDPGSLIRDSATFGILPPASAADREVLWLPRIQRGSLFTFRWTDGPVPVTFSALTIGHRTLTAASGDRVWIVETGSGELTAYDTTGKVTASTRLELDAMSYDPSALERARDAALVTARNARDTLAIRAMYDQAVLPPTMPLVDQLYAGANGEIWLRLFTLEPNATQHFLALNGEGAEVGQVSVPAGLQVEQIGEDFVLVIRRDEMDVESVVVYSMSRR